MNAKKYLYASGAAFIFIFMFDWLFHGIILKDMYQQTASLWRPHDQMMVFFPFITLSQILFSFLFGFIFIKGLENKGITEGLRYGLLIALLSSTHLIEMYASQPIPASIIIAWILGVVVKYSWAGMVIAAIYKPVR